ncbi:hypothetical protein EDE15_4101 [Edaphobacter aggregans]|uniref:Uncharacterized protein n=1 Tax=Edaphobacter aggregans TaxID=570835 RepID=A0A428MNS7_9BACT|nr:hypothetical protein EDE15_4101 [Edaphobacter aggregans]
MKKLTTTMMQQTRDKQGGHLTIVWIWRYVELLLYGDVSVIEIFFALHGHRVQVPSSLGQRDCISPFVVRGLPL